MWRHLVNRLILEGNVLIGSECLKVIRDQEKPWKKNKGCKQFMGNFKEGELA